jgi:hypothetical protein
MKHIVMSSKSIEITLFYFKNISIFLGYYYFNRVNIKLLGHYYFNRVKWTLKFESTNSHDSSLVKKGIGQIIKVCNHF